MTIAVPSQAMKCSAWPPSAVRVTTPAGSHARAARAVMQAMKKRNRRRLPDQELMHGRFSSMCPAAAPNGSGNRMTKWCPKPARPRSGHCAATNVPQELLQDDCTGGCYELLLSARDVRECRLQPAARRAQRSRRPIDQTSSRRSRRPGPPPGRGWGDRTSSALLGGRWRRNGAMRSPRSISGETNRSCSSARRPPAGRMIMSRPEAGGPEDHERHGVARSQQ